MLHFHVASFVAVEENKPRFPTHNFAAVDVAPPDSFIIAIPNAHQIARAAKSMFASGVADRRYFWTNAEEPSGRRDPPGQRRDALQCCTVVFCVNRFSNMSLWHSGLSDHYGSSLNGLLRAGSSWDQAAPTPFLSTSSPKSHKRKSPV